MASIDFDGFLDALAAYLAGRASLRYGAAAGTPAAIWRYQAVEDNATDPYSVLLPYASGSPLEWVPVAVLPLQVKTTGTGRALVARQIQAVHGALLAADGRPLRSAAISPAWRLLGVDLRPPAEVEVDDRNRPVWAFNADLKFLATA
jgi:hypothetical protein